MAVTIGMSMSMVSDKKLTQDELNEIVKQHALWLEDPSKGVRADLSGYNLSELDFSGMDLSEAMLEGSFIHKAKMTRVNLSQAQMKESNFMDVDLTDAILDRVDMRASHLCHSILIRVHAEYANFDSCTMWDNNYTDAVIKKCSLKCSELCDGNFSSADLSGCDLYLADIDYARFKNANLTSVNLTWVRNCYWANFNGANMEHTITTNCSFSDEAIKDVKGLHFNYACPEEGSFIAWMKSHDDKLVKIMVTENALRTGGYSYTCRASEVSILEIYDGENICDETTGLLGDEKSYRKGDLIKAKEYDESLYHNGAGIHFRLSKEEAKRIQYKDED